MSKVDDRLVFNVKEHVIKPLVATFTRIEHRNGDYKLDIKLSEGKWVIEVTPDSDYGEFTMKKIFEEHTTEELKKG